MSSFPPSTMAAKAVAAARAGDLKGVVVRIQEACFRDFGGGGEGGGGQSESQPARYRYANLICRAQLLNAANVPVGPAVCTRTCSGALCNEYGPQWCEDLSVEIYPHRAGPWACGQTVGSGPTKLRLQLVRDFEAEVRSRSRAGRVRGANDAAT